ncbi:MAG: antiviral reverse transcriptase Drt3a [Leptospiraceae bacterium]|nr:antiviral reverse transcriptase Drt3a [Leptospiraceae bacterium]
MIIVRNGSSYYYSQKSLRKAIRSQDFWRFKFRKEDIKKEIERIASFVAVDSNKIVLLNKTKLKSKDVFIAGSLDDTLLLRCTDWILKKGFFISNFDRNEDIKQIINLVSHNKNYSIYRTDIKNFFESIKFNEVVSRLENSDFFNFSVIEYLKSLEQYLKNKNVYTIPRGLSISSTLSNIYLMELDKLIYKDFNVIFYSRYVDDILLITEDDTSEIFNRISIWMNANGLSLNTEKTKHIKSNNPDRSFEYLGYKFIKPNDKYEIGIAEKKINKIKTRICLAIKGFLKDRNYSLLLRRLQFLSGNTEMKIAGRSKRLVHGIRYQYSLASKENLRIYIKELDIFYHKLLKAKRYSVSMKLRNILNSSQYTELKNISFSAGFEKKITRFEDRKSISQIKRIWMHV